jgi:hypothetical protein
MGACSTYCACDAFRERCSRAIADRRDRSVHVIDSRSCIRRLGYPWGCISASGCARWFWVALGFFVGGRQLAKLKPVLVVAPAVIGLPMCVFLVGHGGDFWWLLLVLWFASNILLALVIGLQFHRNLLALSGLAILVTSAGIVGLLDLKISELGRATRSALARKAHGFDQLGLQRYSPSLRGWDLVLASPGLFVPPPASNQTSEPAHFLKYMKQGQSGFYKRGKAAIIQLQFVKRPAWFEPGKTCASRQGLRVVSVSCPREFSPVGPWILRFSGKTGDLAGTRLPSVASLVEGMQPIASRDLINQIQTQETNQGKANQTAIQVSHSRRLQVPEAGFHSRRGAVCRFHIRDGHTTAGWLD